jgi:FtsP/CotA-like multicopper oxidase with cupredoxin domain
MRALFFATLMVVITSGTVFAQSSDCPARPKSGTVVNDPASLQSQNGVLSVDMSIAYAVDQYNYPHYCYTYQSGDGPVEAPTLRLNPGDHLVLNLTNQISGIAGVSQPAMAGMNHFMPGSSGDACAGGEMMPGSTNVHFHGLNVPPVCHQDDVIHTLIQPNDPPFQYKIQIPKNDPPGLYWYHPHPHGMTTPQVAGGASGALIIEGMEKLKPEVAGLPERVMVLRQQFPLSGNGGDEGPYQMSINLQPIFLSVFPLPVIEMGRNQAEFWRVVNASPTEFMTLQVMYGQVAQSLEIIALDGVAVSKPVFVETINLPPAGRAEFIVPGLPDNTYGQLVTNGEDTGPLGDLSFAQPIANIRGNDVGALSQRRMPLVPKAAGPQRFAGLLSQKPRTSRNLYFSETFATAVPNTTPVFFITVEGQKPKRYEPDDPPAIVTQVGAVEDWTIENRSAELHAFHIHQIHFLVLEVNGKPVKPRLQDTITVPYWKGRGPYPRVKLRMDFRDPNIAGEFVYHCHILDHEDGGMMANIQVNPK